MIKALGKKLIVALVFSMLFDTPVAAQVIVDEPLGSANPMAVKGWGIDIVPDVGSVEWRFGLCDGQDIRGCLSALGLPAPVIDFNLAAFPDMADAAGAIEFRELGAVDWVRASVPYAPYEGTILVNGLPNVIWPERTEDLRTAFADLASQAMLKRYPNASNIYADVWSQRTLSDGRQRFVLVETVFDQCRACDILGAAFTFLDFDSTGQLVSRQPIGLLLGDPSQDQEMTAEVIKRRPESMQAALNGLGYNAGPMDGYPGPQSRTALMEFQAEHCLPITGQPDDVTVTALVGADGFSKPCGGAGIPTGISANNPLVPGMYVDDLAKCQLETLPYEDLHLTQRIVRPEGGITFGQEGGCTVRRGDIRDGITLFRGDCSEGNETNDGSWTFDVTSNETFIDRMMHLNAAPRAFAKCPDDSTLRQTWSAWFGRKPANAAARRTLPVTQGIYLNTVAMGTDVTACATGMDSDAALDVSPGVLNFYESRCEVLSSAAGPQPNALNLSLRCTGEGQTWETDSVFRRTSESAFDLDDTRYQLCLVGDASPPGDSTETVPLTDPSERRHVLRGFKNQGIVFTMTIGTKRTSDGVVVRLLKATGTHNPQGNFNPVVAGADVSLSLHVVTRKTCQGCKPGFVEQSPPGLRFSDGQLEVTSLPVEVFVPNAALAGADVIGFALLGVEIGKGRLFLTPETLLIADLDAVPTGGINDDVAVPSASDTPEMTAGTVAIAGELLEVYNRDRTRMALVADNADYAVLAWAAYGQPEAFDAASDRGWNAMESVVNDNLITGDTAAMRFAAADGSQVLAFRGSKTLGDWFTNTVGTLVPSPLTKGQISGAVEIALVMQSQYPDIVFVGHSLGGRLAQVARLRTGNKAVTFNSAPLNLEETGDAVARKLIEALMGRPGITSDVYRFRNPQDALTALSTREQIEVSNVMTAEGIEGFAHLNFPRLATYFAMQQVEVYHSMGMLAGAMQQVKFMRDSEFLEGSAVDLILGGAVVEPAGEAVDPEFEPSSKIKEIYLFDMNYLTKLGLARYFGAPVEVISEGVFPAGIREANQFEQRRMQAAFMATVEQVAQGFAGTDTFKIYLDAQGNGENRNALGQFNFDTMKYRLCLPSNFAMPMDGIGIRGNTFEPGILIRYPTKTKSDMNCSYGELASQRRHSHRSDEYIDINMPNEAVAEAFEVNVKPNLMLRVICDLNASTIALGPNPDGRYRRQKPFKGWPLVCEANKVEGYIDDHAIPAFEIDFTTASPKFSTVIQ